MKKTILLTLILGAAISFSACKKEKKADPIPGCMNATSLNYNPLATVDDASCVVVEQVQKVLVFELTATT